MMARRTKPVTILIAEDDPDDRMLLQDAFEESRISNELRFVEDGEQLIAYLRREGKYAEPCDAPFPGMILLDLNMPRMDGREALGIIKADPALQRIPTIVLTTSKAESDIVSTYGLGVSSFISKPVTFAGLVEVVQALGHYWIEIVELPPEHAATA